MRTVITGGCGFIGSALARFLLHRAEPSDEIILVDTLQRYGRQSGMQKDLPSQVRFVKADLTDPAALSGIKGPVDRLYHLAAIVGVSIVENDSHKVIKDNTLSTMHVLDWFCENRTSDARFLFSSSSEVYSGAYMAGLHFPIPTSEEVPAVITDVSSPRFSYALTKMWGEAYVCSAVQKNDICAVSVRYHNVYGPRMGYEHVIPQIIMRILARENPFTIIAADQTRSFCWVEDAAEATCNVMESPWVKPGSVVHIGNQEAEIQIGMLYEMLFEACGWVPDKKRYMEAPAGSVSRRCPDTRLLCELTGYVPTTPLEQGLKQTVEWYVQHPSGNAVPENKKRVS